MTTPRRIVLALFAVVAMSALAMAGAFSFSPPHQRSASVDWSHPIPTTTTIITPIPPSTIDDVVEASRTVTTTTTAPTTTTTTTTTGSETPPPPPAAQSPTTTTVPASSPKPGAFNPTFENDFAARINGLRAQNGLAALSRSGDLDSSARSWAKTMAERGKLAHSDLGRLIPPWSVAAENVGTGSTTSRVFGLLAGSSGHLANMLGPSFTHMGIGVYVDGTGILWTAHLFAG